MSAATPVTVDCVTELAENLAKTWLSGAVHSNGERLFRLTHLEGELYQAKAMDTGENLGHFRVTLDVESVDPRSLAWDWHVRYWDAGPGCDSSCWCSCIRCEHENPYYDAATKCHAQASVQGKTQ